MRRRGLILVALLVVAAVVAAAVVVATRDDRDPVLTRASDAIGDDPVLHAIVREQITGGQRYDVATGRTRPVTSEYESWIDPERERLHAVQRSGGEVLSDELTDLDAFGPAQETATLVADYRRRLDEGELRVARTGTVDGRKVYWLASTTEEEGIPPFEAAVDAESYRLVRLRTIARYFQTSRDFEQLESMPREDADFAVRFGAPTALRQTRPEGRRVTPAEAARELRGAEWAGERAGGLPLREVRAADWSGSLQPGGEADGEIVTVAYGDRLGSVIDPAVGTPNGIEVVQASNDSEARWFLRPAPLPAAPPPLGAFDLSGESSPMGQFFVASLRKPGVWILVRAPSREQLVETVRALRPIS